MLFNIIFTLLFLISNTVHSTIVEHKSNQNTDGPKSPLQKIADINMKTFPWKRKSWSTNSWKDFLERHLDERLNPKPRDLRYAAFEAFINAEKETSIESLQQKSSTLNDETTWNDLNLFAGQKNADKFVANSIDKTITEYGKISLYQLLACPLDDIKKLQTRQEIVKFFIAHPEVFHDIRNILTELKQAQTAILSFWNLDPLQHTHQDHFMFNNALTKPLNKSAALLTVKSLHDHSHRVYSFLHTIFAISVLASYGTIMLTNWCDMPEKVERWANQYRNATNPVIALVSYLSNRYIQGVAALAAGAYWAAGIPYQYNTIIGCYLFEKALHAIVRPVTQTIAGMKKMHNYIQKYDELKDFDEFKEIITFFTTAPQVSKSLNEFLDNLNDETLYKDSSLFSDTGIISRMYCLIHDIKEHLEPAFTSLGKIDVYTSLAELIKDNENRSSHYCFVDFLQAQKSPHIIIEKFWHPLVDQEKAINNDLEVGGAKKQNLVITGPNAGGKSTIIKALTLNLIMGQTLGIAPASRCAFTPFTSIATYLNITDDLGVGNSLFKSEVLRTQELITKLDGLESNKFSFTVFDEVFNGTSPTEGEAAAYSIAHHLSSYQNNICVVATHFSMLTMLEDATNLFSNYRVFVDLLPDGTINYPYKLEPGISNQNVAIDILRNQGFRSSILDEANHIVSISKQS